MQRLFRFVDRRHNRFEALIVIIAGLRQGDRTRAAKQQLRPQLLFQTGDLLTDRRLRQTQIARGGRQAAQLRHPHKGFHCVQLIHVDFAYRYFLLVLVETLIYRKYR